MVKDKIFIKQLDKEIKHVQTLNENASFCREELERKVINKFNPISKEMIFSINRIGKHFNVNGDKFLYHCEIGNSMFSKPYSLLFKFDDFQREYLLEIIFDEFVFSMKYKRLIINPHLLYSYSLSSNKYNLTRVNITSEENRSRMYTDMLNIDTEDVMEKFKKYCMELLRQYK